MSSSYTRALSVPLSDSASALYRELHDCLPAHVIDELISSSFCAYVSGLQARAQRQHEETRKTAHHILESVARQMHAGEWLDARALVQRALDSGVCSVSQLDALGEPLVLYMALARAATHSACSALRVDRSHRTLTFVKPYCVHTAAVQERA